MRKVTLFAAVTVAAAQLTVAPAQALTWEELLTAGKAEGSVAVIGPINPIARQIVTQEFEKDTGIKVTYEGLSSREVPARITREAAANRLSVDVLLGGSSELRTLHPKGLLAPVKPILVLPEVTDTSKWFGGKLEFTDPEGIYMLRTVSGVYGGMLINTDNLPKDAIKKSSDLLDPKFKGKIVSSPYASGSGSGFAANVLYRKKEDYFKKLYKGQELAFVNNSRAVVEQVARGTYLVGFGIFPHEVEEFKKAGFPLEVVYAEDLPGYVSASSGTAKIIQGAPHPNAAAVFVNWFATRKVQELWMEMSLDPSRRIDVNPTKVPSYTLVHEGIDYLDQHQHEFYLKYRPQVIKQVQELMGR